MGLEAIWKRCGKILVCNAGDAFPEEGWPAVNWWSQFRRVIRMMHRQAVNNSIRWLFALDRSGECKVAYWGVRGFAEAYPAHGAKLSKDDTNAARNAEVSLAPLPFQDAQALIAHGYSLADAAARSFWPEAVGKPSATQLPKFAIDGALAWQPGAP